jgi:translation initiation factor eIF-2B subunit gamma
VKEIVKSDFVVLPCDLVCELGGDKLLQAWMVKSASLSEILGDATDSHSGGLGVWYETKTATPVKGEETDFIATVPLPAGTVPAQKGSLLPHVSKLVYSMPTDSLNDLTEEKKGFPIRHGLLRQHPRIRMLTTHRDAHIYIFPKWVMNFVAENDRLESIGEDVIGWWAKAGWQKGLSEKLGLKKIFESADGQEETPSTERDRTPSDEGDSDKQDDTNQSQDSDKQDRLGREGGDSTPQNGNAGVPPMLAYVHPSQASGPLVRRVDTSKLLLAISLELAKLPSVEEAGPEAASPFAHARKVAYPEGVKARTTITQKDSLVAENVTVQEKTSIKESVIGANCQINEGAKLQQCLLMDGVVIGKNCKLTRCILGRRCEIGDGSTLTDCEVQENLFVEPKSESPPATAQSPVWPLCPLPGRYTLVANEHCFALILTFWGIFSRGERYQAHELRRSRGH